MRGICYKLSLLMRRYKIRRLYVVSALLLLLALVFFFLLDASVSPTVEALAQTELSAVLSESITKAVAEAARENIIDSSSLYKIDKDADGNVTAVSVNASTANTIKAKATQFALQEIEKARGELQIPVGTVAGSNIFSARGGKITVKLLSAGGVTNRLETDFIERGINQTLLRSRIVLDANITALVGGQKTQANVSSEILLTELVIVGKIPQRLTTVEVIDDKTKQWLESFRSS